MPADRRREIADAGWSAAEDAEDNRVPAAYEEHDMHGPGQRALGAHLRVVGGDRACFVAIPLYASVPVVC